MPHFPCFLLVLVSSIGTVLPNSPAGERVRGSSIRLNPPPDYEPAASFIGYQSSELEGSLMIFEFEEPYSEVSKGLEDHSALAQQGIKVVSRAPRRMGDAPGQLLRVTQAVGEVEADKWLWCFGTEEKSVLITGICPKGAPGTTLDALLTAILSAEWDPAFVPSPHEGVAFSLLDTAGLELLPGAIGALVYSVGGEVDETGRQPSFIAAPAIRPTLDTDREQSAKRRLLQRDGYRQFQLQDPRPITVDGLEGYSIHATAEDRDDGSPRAIYQVMLFDGASYWLLTGQVAAGEGATWMPIFERMAASFRRKHDTLSSPVGGPRITVPATWSTRRGLNDEADLQAGSTIGECFVIVLSEPKAELESVPTLEAFSELSRAWLEGPAIEQVGPVELRVGDLRALRIEYIPTTDEADAAFLHVSLEGPTSYHQVVFWTLPPLFDTCRNEFDRILGTFEEVE